MDKAYLLMWLEGPLQSWGVDSRYGRRDSLPFPSKSGVFGLVCAAMGAGGEQTQLLARLAHGDFQVMAFTPQRDGTAAVRQPLLEDFQMVGSGYDDKDPWLSLLIPKTSEGKKAVGGGTKLTYRYYLQDMTFAVFIELDSDLASVVKEALQSPVWDLSLGRKNCVPTEFIGQGVFPSLSQAKDQALVLAESKSLVLNFFVEQGEKEADEVLTLNDVPVQFGVNKRYRDRQVSIFYAEYEEQRL